MINFGLICQSFEQVEGTRVRICFIGYGRHVNILCWVKYLADTLVHEIHLITFGKAESPYKRIKILV